MSLTEINATDEPAGPPPRRPVPLAELRTERSRDERRAILTEVMLAPDPAPGLWSLCDSGLALEVVPELPALRLEQDPIHRHKDVLAHTIAVVAKTRPDLTVRLAALFHDIAKPATRSYEHGGVTFRHHEAVGAKMTKARLRELGFEPQVVKDVAELVRLSGRFKGYAEGWTDSAVRRYARDAGPLLGQLNELVRCDCTTRNQAKADRLQQQIDDMEARIVELARQEREAAERPQLDGQAVMARLGISAGPDVGAALRFLLELKRAEGLLPPEVAGERLDAWWAERVASGQVGQPLRGRRNRPEPDADTVADAPAPGSGADTVADASAPGSAAGAKGDPAGPAGA